MSTITEVAVKAGVSKATVSRVISGTTFVKDETKSRVLAAIEALNYTPNQAARSLAGKKSYTVGLVLFDINSDYYAPAASAVESALRKEDLHVIIASGQGTQDGERDAVEFLIKRQVDALVLITSFLSKDELEDLEQRCPIFVLNQERSMSADKTIQFDNYKGGFIATDYLINQGHSKIGIITGPSRKTDAMDRLRGYQDALQAKGLQSHWHHEGDFSAESAIAGMQTFLAMPDKPTALVCGNDYMAIGALHVCYQHGIRVPDELAVVGFDDLDIAQYFKPTLTTVKMPLFNMADALAKLLLQQIYQKKHSVQRYFAPEMVIRQSA
ncbi:LacI family transcriptional regulator [Marinomonas agarivorans]|nr:LacI family transcriptional regulator [Marinomonas agarivorans]